MEKASLLDRSAHELSETRTVMEQLQQLVRQKDEELAAYESQKLMLESLAQERLQEVIALRQQLYHAGSRVSTHAWMRERGEDREKERQRERETGGERERERGLLKLSCIFHSQERN